MDEEELNYELTDRVVDMLYNYKFLKAYRYAVEDDCGKDAVTIIKSLSNMFVDSGWFYGDMGMIVDTTIAFLMGKQGES